MKIKLPAELDSFIENGGTTLYCEDGDWDLKILAAADSPFVKELPKAAVMIAENGSGDCLFLKNAQGKLNTRVFVYWHEEDRSEVFAPALKGLLESASTRNATEAPLKRAEGRGMSVGELEKALARSKPGTLVLSDALKKLKAGPFNVEVLPFLRKVILTDDVISVNEALDCIAALGPSANEAAEAAGGFSDLPTELFVAGSKLWDYSLYCNSYSGALNALQKIEADEDLIFEYVSYHIGHTHPGDLVESLRALQKIGTKEAKDLMKRATTFWWSELNLRERKEIEKISKA